MATFTNDFEQLTVEKTLTVDGDGAQKDQLFELTGSCEIVGMYGVCTAVTDATTFSGTYWEIFGNGSNVSLTNNTGTNLSGITVGGMLIRKSTASSPLTFANNVSDPVLTDGTGATVLFPCIITQVNGADTFIRFCFTGDANTNVTIKFTIKYVPLTDGASIVAV